jgi:hypothetical protein
MPERNEVVNKEFIGSRFSTAFSSLAGFSLVLETAAWFSGA